MPLISEMFCGYTLKAAPVRTPSGRWTVSVVIESEFQGEAGGRRFYADDGISYILEVEAAKECINLGRNLIKKGLVN